MGLGGGGARVDQSCEQHHKVPLLYSVSTLASSLTIPPLLFSQDLSAIKPPPTEQFISQSEIPPNCQDPPLASLTGRLRDYENSPFVGQIICAVAWPPWVATQRPPELDEIETQRHDEVIIKQAFGFFKQRCRALGSALQSLHIRCACPPEPRRQQHKPIRARTSILAHRMAATRRRGCAKGQEGE